jgi:HSP20 family protein
MSAQRSNQQSTSQSGSKEERSSKQSSLALRATDILPSLSSLVLDPFGFFNDSPFGAIRRMQDELNRAVSQTGRTGDGGDVLSTTVWVPPIEVAMRDGNFVVSAELPGVQDEDISVQITDDAVVIQGERQVQREENREGIRRSEIRYGQFFRAIPLPDGADPDQARAEFNNGVLRISVPVAAAKSNVREIPVQSSGSSQSAQSQSAGSSQSAQGRTEAGEQKSGSAESPAQKAA